MAKTHHINNYPALVDFLSNHSVAVIAVPIDNQGIIHSAALRYFNQTEPLTFYFVTDRDSQKCSLLKMQGEVTAAAVVGTEMDTPFTLQMRGKIQIKPASEKEAAVNEYYRKRGNRGDDIDDPKNVLLVFTPNWGRFTDYSKGYDHNLLELSQE